MAVQLFTRAFLSNRIGPVNHFPVISKKSSVRVAAVARAIIAIAANLIVHQVFDEPRYVVHFNGFIDDWRVNY